MGEKKIKVTIWLPEYIYNAFIERFKRYNDGISSFEDYLILYAEEDHHVNQFIDNEDEK